MLIVFLFSTSSSLTMCKHNSLPAAQRLKVFCLDRSFFSISTSSYVAILRLFFLPVFFYIFVSDDLVYNAFLSIFFRLTAKLTRQRRNVRVSVLPKKFVKSFRLFGNVAYNSLLINFFFFSFV